MQINIWAFNDSSKQNQIGRLPLIPPGAIEWQIEMDIFTGLNWHAAGSWPVGSNDVQRWMWLMANDDESTMDVGDGADDDDDEPSIVI